MELKTSKETTITEGNPMFILGAQEQRKLDRQEAIEWIKTGEVRHWGFDPYCCPDSIESWIKHFFDITEEDLDEK